MAPGGWGATIGSLWGAASYFVLVVPALREGVRSCLQSRMTYLLPILPSAWVAPLFGSWNPHGFLGVALPLGASMVAGAVAGAVAGIVLFGRR